MGKKILIGIWGPRFHGYLPPLGYLQLASYLYQKGHAVEIVDVNRSPSPLEEFTKAIKSRDFDVFIAGTSYKWHNNCPSNTVNGALQLCQAVKQHKPTVSTILVGPLNSIIGSQLVTQPQVDVVINGEPELIAERLLSTGSHKVEGITYLADGKAVNTGRSAFPDLRRLPPTRYDLIDIEKYIFDSYFAPRVGGILNSRGCRYNCSFCFSAVSSLRNAAHTGSYFRVRQPGIVVEEMEILVRKYGARGIRFEDNDLCGDRKNLVAICELIIKKGLHRIPWRCAARADSVDEELLGLMASAGCVDIIYGVEFGDQEILKRSCKGLDKAKIKEIFELTRRLGIQADASFILGLPGETRRSIENTIDFAIELKCGVATFHPLCPFPGAPINKDSQIPLDGIDQLNIYTADTAYCSISPFSTQELEKLAAKASRRFYLRPTYILKTAAKLRYPWFTRFIINAALNRSEGSLVHTLLLRKTR